MYYLNYSKAQPRENQMQKLVAIALSMTQSFARQIRRCLVEDKQNMCRALRINLMDISWHGTTLMSYGPGGKE